jgi:hypothetical protein
MKRMLVYAFSLLIAPVMLAAAHPLYRIELRNGSEVLSKDRPTHQGSILIFHAYPGGALTGVPDEEVLAVATASGKRRAFHRLALDQVVVTPETPHQLAPGEIVYLGPTGGEPTVSETGTATAARPPSLPGGVYDPRMPIYGGYSGRPTAPNGAPAPGTSGDLARAISASPPTAGVDANGFPTTSAAAVPVDANGFPMTPGTNATSVDENGFPMSAGAATPVIGPDGTPVLAPNGSPGSASPAMGPNGTPVLAQPGAPGSAPPVIGPNGTPVLASPGAPGSTPPAVGPNGYPAAPPPPSPRR